MLMEQPCEGSRIKGGEKFGGARFKAASEMLCPCAWNMQQAAVKPPGTKISLTRPTMVGITLLKVIEQLLHKIKANRQREDRHENKYALCQKHD